MKGLRAASRLVCTPRPSSVALSRPGSRPASSAAVALDSYVEESELLRPQRQTFPQLSAYSASPNAAAGPSTLKVQTASSAASASNNPIVSQLVNSHNLASETYDFPRSTEAWNLYMSLPAASRRDLPVPYLKQILRAVVPAKHHLRRFLAHSLRLRNYKAIEERGSILEARLQTVIADLRRSLSNSGRRPRATRNDYELDAGDYAFAMSVLSPFGRLKACEDIWTEMEHTDLALAPRLRRSLLRRRIAVWGHFVDYHPVPPTSKSKDPEMNKLEHIMKLALPTIVNEGPRVDLMAHPPLMRTLTLNLGKVVNRVRDVTLQQAMYGVIEGLLVKGYGVDMRYLTVAENARVPLGAESLNVLLAFLGFQGEGWRMVSALEVLGEGRGQAIRPGKWDEDVDEDEDMSLLERSSHPATEENSSTSLLQDSSMQSIDLSDSANPSTSRFYIASRDTDEDRPAIETEDHLLGTSDEPRKFSDFYRPSYVPENPVSSPPEATPRTFDDFYPSTSAAATSTASGTLYTTNIFLTMMDQAKRARIPDPRLALHVLRLAMLADEAAVPSPTGDPTLLPLARAKLFESAWRVHHSSLAARLPAHNRVLSLARRHEQRLADRLVAVAELIELDQSDNQDLTRARSLLQQEKIAMEVLLDKAQKEMLAVEHKRRKSQVRFRRKRLEAKIAAVQVHPAASGRHSSAWPSRQRQHLALTAYEGPLPYSMQN